MQLVGQTRTRARSSFRLIALPVVAMTLPALAEPTGTAFTYRAQLKQNGVPLSGSVDLELGLFDAETEGLPLAVQTFMNVEAVSGQFAVEVDFGPTAFTGEARWIETAIRAPHDPDDLAPFTTLEPRQRINSVPYATHALNAEERSSLDAPAGGPADALIVDPNGNIGIGTTTPMARFHVRGADTRGQTITFVDQSQYQFDPEGVVCDPYQSFVAGATGRLLQARIKLNEDLAPSNGTLNIYEETKAGPVFIAEVSGTLLGARFDEVGLSFSATTAPEVVAGKTYSFAYVLPQNLSVCGARSAYPWGRGECRVGGNDQQPGDLWFETVLLVQSPGEDVVIDSAGRVGIGTLQPAGKLHVENGPNALDQFQHDQDFSIERIDTSWQSFRAGTDGRLSRVLVKLSDVRSPAQVTLRIYEGEGTAGPLLAEAQGLPIAGEPGDIVTLQLPEALAPAVTAGELYTFEGVFPPLTSVYAKTGDPYPDGTLGGGSEDLWFETYVTGTVSGLIFAPNGNLGIGTATPTCKLSVVGPACAESFLELSDARLKQNIEPLTGALDVLSELTGVRFDWTSAAIDEHRLPQDRQIGFIAQDLQKVLPEVVRRDGAGFYAIDYGRITPLLVQAIRELQSQADARLAARDQRLTELERQNRLLQSRLDQLEARLAPDQSN